MINSVDTVVGNLDKGANTNVDLSLKGTKAGSGDVKVTVNYEDSTGKEYSIEKTMNLSVTEPVPVELAAEEAAAGSSNLIVMGVAVIGAVVVIIVVVNIIRKVREKKYA